VSGEPAASAAGYVSDTFDVDGLTRRLTPPVRQHST